MIRQTVAGRYDLEYELGAGTLATVYQALDVPRRQVVALKLFARHLCADEGVRQALLDHARKLGELDHPNVARVLGAGVDDGQVYVVTELVQGGSVRALMNSTDRLLPDRGIEIASQVAEALEAAHRLDIVHGDLRPENVLLDSSGNAKVTDFGWADVFEGAGVIESPALPRRAAYLAARQRAGTGAPADVYLLAALLYEMLAGRIPPAPPRPRPPAAYSPRPFNPGVPVWLERVVAYALGDDPSRRYRHAAALRMALQAPSVAPIPASVPYSLASVRRGPTVRGVLQGVGRALLRLLLIGVPTLAGGFVVAAVLTTFFVGKLVLAGPVSDLAEVDAPSFVGMSLTDAQEKAMSLGLTVARSSERPTTDRPKDTVLNQWPVPGTSVRRGTVIRLAVSSGLTVPGVVGKSVDDARRDLEAAGWQVGVTDAMPTLWAAPGTVVQQSPSPEEMAPDKGPIKLTLAALPPNLAERRPVRVSSGTNVDAAVDGNVDTSWNSSAQAPGWIEMSLDGPHTVQRVELVAAMKPDGWAAHEVWVVDSNGKEQRVHVFGGEWRDGQVLSQTFAPGIADVVKVRIVTPGSVSYPAWREIRIY